MNSAALPPSIVTPPLVPVVINVEAIVTSLSSLTVMPVMDSFLVLDTTDDFKPLSFVSAVPVCSSVYLM